MCAPRTFVHLHNCSLRDVEVRVVDPREGANYWQIVPKDARAAVAAVYQPEKCTVEVRLDGEVRTYPITPADKCGGGYLFVYCPHGPGPDAAK
jgi:hypothetical protein